MNVSEMNNKEVSLLKTKLKRAYSVSKAIYEYKDYIDEIKDYIALDQLVGASEIWADLGIEHGYSVQKLLYTAPLYGGVFTTEERAIVKGFWIVTTDDIEGIK